MFDDGTAPTEAVSSPVHRGASRFNKPSVRAYLGNKKIPMEDTAQLRGRSRPLCRVSEIVTSRMSMPQRSSTTVQYKPIAPAYFSVHARAEYQPDVAAQQLVLSVKIKERTRTNMDPM